MRELVRRRRGDRHDRQRRRAPAWPRAACGVVGVARSSSDLDEAGGRRPRRRALRRRHRRQRRHRDDRERRSTRRCGWRCSRPACRCAARPRRSIPTCWPSVPTSSSAGCCGWSAAVDARLQPGSRIVCFAGSLGLEPRATEAGPGAINAGLFNLMRQLSLLYGPRGDHDAHDQPGSGRHPAAAGDRGGGRGRESASRTTRCGRRTRPATRSAGCPLPTRSPGASTLLLDPEADVMHGGVLYLDAGGHRGIH